MRNIFLAKPCKKWDGQASPKAISKKNQNLAYLWIYSLKKTLTLLLWPVFMDGLQLPQGESRLEEAVYFLPLSSQIFLVLILPNSEG